jgi:hypothetical protein
MARIHRLPSQFPDGTRYVIEGREGQIVTQYLEFPDGRHVDLPTDRTSPPERARTRRRLRSSAARNHLK